MDITIRSEKTEPLLSRRCVVADVSYTGVTPSRLELRKKLAEYLKAPENLVIVNRIWNADGHTKAVVTVHLYTDEKDIQLEPKHILERHSPERKKKAKESKEGAGKEKETKEAKTKETKEAKTKVPEKTEG